VPESKDMICAKDCPTVGLHCLSGLHTVPCVPVYSVLIFGFVCSTELFKSGEGDCYSFVVVSYVDTVLLIITVEV
jgi:hypothetical protein